MMALSGKYGKLDIPKIADGEPVFILRAQDKLAEKAVRMYQLLAESHGSPLSAELDRVVDAFQKWKGSKKMPD
ncbi:hypothetical protein EHM92_09585 [bacterium]|nr:MAG: hypothetical protein EHM92_09585 [bacterium]